MLKIAICDDEKVFRDNINKYVAAYLNEKEISYEIDTFSSGKEIIDLGIEIKQYNIIFLDINMDDVDGIVTAQKIREYSSEIYIVFVTAYINYSLVVSLYCGAINQLLVIFHHDQLQSMFLWSTGTLTQTDWGRR